MIGLLLQGGPRVTGKFELYPFKSGEILTLRKTHPCGNNVWTVVRTGQEVTVKCIKCNHQISMQRRSLEKAVKKIEKIESDKSD